MPVQPCQKNKIKGWKAGPTQKCYTSSNAKKKATKQFHAINISKARKSGHKI